MKKILLIDDASEFRKLTVEMLNLEGFETYAAEDGLTGVELALKHLPDLIICDLHMPRLDGYGTLAALRKNSITATIPVIFMTGLANRGHHRRSMELGADDFLSKPFTMDELFAAVRARLDKHETMRRRFDEKFDELRGNIGLALPHELQTPLSGILGLSSLLLEDFYSMTSQAVYESLQYINEDAVRLHRLIENFLAYTQIEMLEKDTKKLQAMREVPPMPVHEFIADYARSKSEKVDRVKDLILRIEPVFIRLPTDHLKKIVEELIDNAFKFSQPGTLVHVNGRLLRNQLQLLITDHGRGMTKHQISQIGPHMQFDRKEHEQQGMGLGLIIAKRLVDLHGGNLTIESVPTKRTSVRVQLTVRPEDQITLEETKEANHIVEAHAGMVK